MKVTKQIFFHQEVDYRSTRTVRRARVDYSSTRTVRTVRVDYSSTRTVLSVPTYRGCLL